MKRTIRFPLLSAFCALLFAFFINHAFNKGILIGEAHWLRAIFESSVEITDIKRDKKSVVLHLKNNSGLLFRLAKTAHDEKVVYFRNYDIKPHKQHTIKINLPGDKAGAEINFEITNLRAGPDKGLEYTFNIPPAP